MTRRKDNLPPRAKPAGRAPKFATVTLGCEKNLVDSEELVGVLAASGWRHTRRLNEANAILVNTCAFIAPAQQESLEAIEFITAVKDLNPDVEIYVFGCLAKKSVPRLQAQFDGALNGVFESHHEVLEHLTGRVPAALKPRPTETREKVTDWNAAVTLARKPLTPPWYAYLKISEGCSRRCSFCIIPRLRGTHHSKPMALIAQEAKFLVDRGVREINVIAQDSTLYGRDIPGGGAGLPDVLKLLSGLDGLDWIRVFYLYPHGVTSEILDAFHRPKVLPYFDVPVQHASQRVLDRMARDGSIEDYERIFRRIGDEFENPYLRTSMIVGFPGETQEDFEATLEFLRRWKFNGVSAFAYSREELSKSYPLPEQAPEEVKRERLGELTRVQAEIQFERNRSYIGRTVEAVVERPARAGGEAEGRAWFQAPDVDGVLGIRLAAPRRRGEHISVTVNDAVETDFVGVEADG